MGFLPNYDNPGPERDLPRKTGIFRLWETLSWDFWDLFRAGFLALLGCAPFLLEVAYSLSAHVLIYAPAAGLLGGAIAGPELCGLADTVLRGLQDEPGFWWHTYRRAWRQNAGACLLPGAVGGCLLSTQVFLLFHAGALGLNMAAGAGLAAGGAAGAGGVTVPVAPAGADGADLCPAGEKLRPALSGAAALEPGCSGHCVGLSVGNGPVLFVSGSAVSGDQSLGPGSARPLPDLPRH